MSDSSDSTISISGDSVLDSFQWDAELRRDPRPEWAGFSRFLSEHGLVLYGTREFHRAPPAPARCSRSPFQPKDDENFVFSVYPGAYRTGRGTWGHVNPYVQLALDSRYREVIIKAVPPGSLEGAITQRLASPPLCDMPENHTVPVVSVLHCDRATFLVEARWGRWWAGEQPSDLRFWAATQAYQLLEGLAFMHEHGIAHGDIHGGNVVCNFDMARTTPEPCARFAAFRTSCNFRVAFIDFGASVQFEGPGPHRIAPRAEGPMAPSRAPELDGGSPFDPFAADVFSMGRLLLHFDPPVPVPTLYQTLLDDMTNSDPACRPSARLAFERLKMLNSTQLG